MPSNYEQILNDFSNLSGDYRGEVFAAELIQNGLPFDKIYFKTLSVFNRPISNDISAVKLDQKENGGDQLLLELNREGLYDMLPEGIFHFKDNRAKRKDKEITLENIQKAREEEKGARKFFGPFENEFFQLRLQLELKKRSLLRPGYEETNRDFFENIFGDASLLNEHQVLALLYILPLAHKIRGDIEKISHCIHILIKYDVEIISAKISYVAETKGDSLKEELAGLGNAKLGIDTIVGNSFRSMEPVFEIHIKNIEKEKLVSFFPGGSNFSVVHYVSDFLFPCNSKYQVKIHLKKEDRAGFLSQDKNKSYLGFNSYL